MHHKNIIRNIPWIRAVECLLAVIQSCWNTTSWFPVEVDASEWTVCTRSVLQFHQLLLHVYQFYAANMQIWQLFNYNSHYNGRLDKLNILWKWSNSAMLCKTVASMQMRMQYDTNYLLLLGRFLQEHQWALVAETVDLTSRTQSSYSCGWTAHGSAPQQ